MAKPDQAELTRIFEALKDIIAPFEKGTVVARANVPGKYDLWSEKELEAHGQKKNEMFFVALMIQGGFVGFYFMPVYTHPDEVRPQLGEALLRTLKGKSCFHIKNTDPLLMEQIGNAMQTGYKLYKNNGWIG